MTNTTATIEGFELEPGEVIGSRFRVERANRLDTAWPVIAVDLEHDHLPVQLAVRPLGPLRKDESAVEGWDEPWPESHPSCQLPMIHCPRLRHGGGVLAVCATVHLAPAITGSCHTEADLELLGEPAVGDEVVDAPSWVLEQLIHLRLLHKVSDTLERLHHSHQAHGDLTGMDFRRGPEGGVLLRPAPLWNRSVGPVNRAMALDRAALQRMVCQAASNPGDLYPHENVLGLVHDEEGVIRARLRAVLQRKFRSPGAGGDTAAWRLVLAQLTREIEAAVLTDTARSLRQAFVESLLLGQVEDALEMASASPDPWCHDLHHRLEDRRAQTHAEYEDWLSSASERPLLEGCEQLSKLMRRGFTLPAPPVPELDQRLRTCSLHLRQAATAIQRRAWQQARHALSAATSLDPANPNLASLMACIPRHAAPGNMGA